MASNDETDGPIVLLHNIYKSLNSHRNTIKKIFWLALSSFIGSIVFPTVTNIIAQKIRI